MRRIPRPAAALLGAALALGVLVAAAQEARTDPSPGDLVWALADEPPFYDQRVLDAIASLVDAQAVMESVGAWPDVQLLPADEETRRFALQPGAADQAPLLFAAAGINLGNLRAVGDCRVWVSDLAGDPPAEVREAAATALVDELRLIFAEQLEVKWPACTSTDSPAEAHVLVWGASEEPPAIPQRDEGTLFAFPPGPGPQPGTGAGGGGPETEAGAPLPSGTGAAGLAAVRAEPAISQALALLAAVVLVAAGRSAASRSARGGR